MTDEIQVPADWHGLRTPMAMPREVYDDWEPTRRAIAGAEAGVPVQPYVIWHCEEPGCDWRLNGARRTARAGGEVLLALHEVGPLIRAALEHHRTAHARSGAASAS